MYLKRLSTLCNDETVTDVTAGFRQNAAAPLSLVVQATSKISVQPRAVVPRGLIWLKGA